MTSKNLFAKSWTQSGLRAFDWHLPWKKEETLGWAVDKLDLGIERLKVATEDPMISGGLLEELQTAEDMLYDTDRRNSLYRTLLCSGIDRAELPNFLKCQRVQGSTSSEDCGSEGSRQGRPVKRRRLEYHPLSRTKKFHPPGDGHQPHAPVQRADFNRPQDLDLLDSRYACGCDDSENTEDEYSSDDYEIVEGLP
jgi:hypothetical protein